MALLDKIKKMREQGVNDSQITTMLIDEGVSPREISEAFAQLKVKAAIIGEESNYSQTQGNPLPQRTAYEIQGQQNTNSQQFQNSNNNSSNFYQGQQTNINQPQYPQNNEPNSLTQEISTENQISGMQKSIRSTSDTEAYNPSQNEVPKSNQMNYNQQPVNNQNPPYQMPQQVNSQNPAVQEIDNEIESNYQGGPGYYSQEQGYYQEPYNQNQQGYYEGYGPQNYEPYNDYYSQGFDIETIKDISSQVIEDKLSDLQKEIDSVIKLRTNIKFKIQSMENRIAKLEAIIEQLQYSIIKKIGEYGEKIENISNEMQFTQSSFAKLINPIFENQKEKLNKKEETDKKQKKQIKKTEEDDIGGFEKFVR